MDPRTIYPVLLKLCHCLPRRYRAQLSCGVGSSMQVSTELASSACLPLPAMASSSAGALGFPGP